MNMDDICQISSRRILAESGLEFLDHRMRLQHRAGSVGVVRLRIFVDLPVVSCEDVAELSNQGFERVPAVAFLAEIQESCQAAADCLGGDF